MKFAYVGLVHWEIVWWDSGCVVESGCAMSKELISDVIEIDGTGDLWYGGCEVKWEKEYGMVLG